MTYDHCPTCGSNNPSIRRLVAHATPGPMVYEKCDSKWHDSEKHPVYDVTFKTACGCTQVLPIAMIDSCLQQHYHLAIRKFEPGEEPNLVTTVWRFRRFELKTWDMNSRTALYEEVLD